VRWYFPQSHSRNGFRAPTGLEFDPEREINGVLRVDRGDDRVTVGCHQSRRSDELVIFEPYYENYGPDALMCGAERKS